MQDYLNFWRNYFNFSGRASRRDYWMTVLINFGATLILALIAATIHPLTFLYYLYLVACILPMISLAIRRLHDIGRSGWWVLIDLIPIVGSLILLVWLLTRSSSTNEWEVVDIH